MYIKIWWVNEEYERMRNNSPDQRASTIPHSRGTGNEEAGEVVPQWEGDPKSSGDDDCGGFSLWLPQDLKAGHCRN